MIWQTTITPWVTPVHPRSETPPRIVYFRPHLALRTTPYMHRSVLLTRMLARAASASVSQRGHDGVAGTGIPRTTRTSSGIWEAIDSVVAGPPDDDSCPQMLSQPPVSVRCSCGQQEKASLGK